MKRITFYLLASCLVSCGSNNSGNINNTTDTTSVSLNTTVSVHNLPGDSITIPVFAYWTPKNTSGRYDGLYDSVTSLFRPCVTGKTEEVKQGDNVTIAPLNKCSSPGDLRAFACVVNFQGSPQFMTIIGLDSTMDDLLLLTTSGDTVLASAHKFLPTAKEKIKTQIYLQNPGLREKQQFIPMLKRDPRLEQRVIIHKSFIKQ